jgi:soluble lytic murein transglycosylase-like protein
MQVTPEAGRDTAKRFGITYDWNRLVSGPVYNTQMGAAEVAALLKECGSYVMAFAGYNAGRGRVAEWVARHGDPRDPKVDAVDSFAVSGSPPIAIRRLFRKSMPCPRAIGTSRPSALDKPLDLSALYPR